MMDRRATQRFSCFCHTLDVADHMRVQRIKTARSSSAEGGRRRSGSSISGRWRRRRRLDGWREAQETGDQQDRSHVGSFLNYVSFIDCSFSTTNVDENGVI